MKTSVDTLKTMQSLSKLAGYDKNSSGGSVLDHVGSLIKTSGTQKGGKETDAVIDPLLDTAIAWMGDGGRTAGLRILLSHS